MQNHLDFLPLRRDFDEQLRLFEIAQSANRSWSARPEVRQILDEFEKFGQGADIDECDALSRLFKDPSNSREFAGRISRHVLDMLSDEPLAQPEFGDQADSSSATIQLAKHGRAELSLTCFDARDESSDQIQSMGFYDCDRHEIIVAGEAEALFALYDPSANPAEKVSTWRERVSQGHAFHASSGSTFKSKTYTRIAKRVVVLRLVRRPLDPQPAREIRISDGAVLSQSNGSKHASCQEVMMATLGRMGRKDAVPAMSRLARNGDEHLRWEAIRQCLALDFRVGFDLLCEAATAPNDPLSGIASALRAQLIEAHPQLAELERELCHA